VVFVTHAVEEAVLLSDRGVVMTAGRIEEDIKLKLERPCDITAIECNYAYVGISRNT
jgi:NitT/TauT family transport system ATP-binding protein/sulfonate transport system ATP-binding protein